MSRYLSVNNIDKDVTASQPVWLLTLGTIPLFREVNLHLIYIQGILQFTNSTPCQRIFLLTSMSVHIQQPLGANCMVQRNDTEPISPRNVGILIS